MRFKTLWKSIASFLLVLFASLTLSGSALAQSVVNQPIVGLDTYVRSSAPYTSFGSDPYVIDGGWGDYYAVLFLVDNTAMPLLASGEKAELALFNVGLSTNASTTQMRIGMIDGTTPWNESSTYSSMMSIKWYPSTLKMVSVGNYNTWTFIDVTDYVKLWKSGANVNNGMYFQPQAWSSNNFNFFASLNNPNSDLRPYLRVTRVAPPTTKFLDFPLSATLYPQGAYTLGKVTTVLDHSMTTAYTSPDGTILTFTGEQFVTDSKHPVVKNACYPIKKGMTWSTLLKSLYYGTTYDGCGSGVAMNYESHTGYDYRAGTGTAVYAAANGKVVSANGGCIPKGLPAGCVSWGAIGIDHENGIITQYLHLSKIEVLPGQKITAGMRIGYSGNTSPFSLPPHLHFEALKRRAGYPESDYQPDHYAYIDPYGFDVSKGPTDYLANTTGTAGGIPSLCLWKSGCTNP